MFTDKLTNLDKYLQIPKSVKTFLKNIPKDCGRYVIDENIYVNIEEYSTKDRKISNFELHKDYADIQILLDGKEELDICKNENIQEIVEYNPTKDIAFYQKNDNIYETIILDGTNFIYIEPEMLHRPQIKFKGNSQKVRKLVVKIKIKR